MFLGWVGFGLEGNSGYNGSKLVISILPDTPMPRRRLLRLSGHETEFSHFSGPPRLTSPPRCTS